MEEPSSVDKPVFHVAPAAGWVNDPNGPFMYKGRYHLFYQHLPEGCEWAFGLVWGHAVSSDLVHWQHLPHAVVPTAKSLDADGCFSGCAAVDVDGVPVLLYTGVRLRTNPDAQPPPPPECDLNLPFIESQLYATPADPDDPLLVAWVKEEAPFIGLPPPNMNLTGWRDPFVVERPCEANNHEWIVLMGSGIKDVGGATIVYRTTSLRDAAAWRYDGLLCVGDGETGAVWECPLLLELNPAPAGGVPLGSSAHGRLAAGMRRSLSHLGAAHGGGGAAAADDQQQQQQQQPEPPDDVACANRSGGGASASASAAVAAGAGRPLGLVVNPAGASPPGCCACGSAPGAWDERYTHFYSISPDACTNPTIYWLGRYGGGRFELEGAKGPLRLDLGDVLYAPNVMRDDGGRLVLWGWLQERRTVGTYDYAGCMSVPRLLHLDGDRLHQSPAPELLALRRGEAWSCSHAQLGPGASLPLPGVVGSSQLDIEVVFTQGTATTVGLLLRSWNQSGEGGAAVLFNWESAQLEVVFEALDPATMTFSLVGPGARRIGGPVTHKPGQPLALRLLLDGSVLEVFTGSGEVLSTRVYRGAPPHDHADAGIEAVALDGSAALERLAAYEMATIWPDREQQQQQQAAVASAAVAAAAAGAPLWAGGAAGVGDGGALEGLQLLAAELPPHEQLAALDKAASGPPGVASNRSAPLSLAGSLRSPGAFESLAAADAAAGKLQQLLLSPQPSATVAAATPPSPSLRLHVPEEEMAADIFDLEGL